MNRSRSRSESIPHASPWHRSLTAVGSALLVVLAASCGGDDDGADDEPVAAETSATPTPDSTDVATDDPAETPPVEDVASCLADAGWETTTNDELLSEQQRADLETLFGQVDGLTFTGAAFAGGISFFRTPDQATERAGQLNETAVVLVPVGPALISIEAGSDYEDAVAAAESCLT